MSSVLYLPGILLGQRGLPNTFEFEELVMGDRRFPDRYRLNSVDGFYGTDVRDTRDPNPQGHGETAFPAWHSGRLMTFEGFIEAGNFNKLYNMASVMERATNDLSEEKTLYIRSNGPGWLEKFMTSERLFELNTTGPVFVANPGRLTGTNASLATIFKTSRSSPHLYNRTVVDFMTGPSTVDPSFHIDAVGKMKSNGDFLSARIIGSGAFSIISSIGGVETTLQTVTIGGGLQPNTRYWIRCQVSDDTDIYNQTYGWIVYAELAKWDLTNKWLGGEPGFNLVNNSTSIPSWLFSVLAGTPLTTFGAGVTGYGGLRWTPRQAGDHVKSVRVTPLEDKDLEIKARRASAVAIKDSQNEQGNSARRPFMLSLRASDPRFLGLQKEAATFKTSTQRNSVPNRGNIESNPVIKLIGPMNFPRLANILAGTTLAIDATIATGDYYWIDVANKTVRDSNGVNQISKWKSGSDWLTLLPGTQDILWSRANASNSAEYVSFYYWDAWT